MVVQDSEVVTLLFTVTVAIAAPAAARGMRFRGLTPALVGFCLVAAGSLSTVLEGLWWYEGFNFLEHLCHAAAGIAFVVALFRANLRERTRGSA